MDIYLHSPNTSSWRGVHYPFDTVKLNVMLSKSSYWNNLRMLREFTLTQENFNVK